MARMAELTKIQFCKSNQILPFEFPMDFMLNPHWSGAFPPSDLVFPPLPVSPKGALFKCVSPTKRHVETQIKLSAEFHAFINGICKAICCAWQDWAKQAVLQDVVINAATAVGGKVTGPEWTPIIQSKGPKDTKMKTHYTNAVAKALGDGWKKYEASLKPAGLPWYPRFAASPPGTAPPSNNVATPVVQLFQDTSALTRGALAKAMMANLDRNVSLTEVISVASTAATASASGLATAAIGETKKLISGSIRPHAGALMDSIAYAFETCFQQWQQCSLVSQVLGTGTNPSNMPGPVVAGKGNMTPGGFDAMAPDAQMMFEAIGPKEGYVSGLYDDKAPGPNMSKPARGLDWGGSHAIGYGTDLGKTYDPANLTPDQLFKRGLFNQIGYSNDDFDKFMKQELFLRDGEGEKLFGLTITDPQDGYIKVAKGMFPNLNSYSLDQQVGVIDLMYNYGSGNLKKYGQSVIDAIKGGDFKKAGDEVLNLPDKGKTFGEANPTRASSIRSSLQSPKPPDPCA